MPLKHQAGKGHRGKEDDSGTKNIEGQSYHQHGRERDIGEAIALAFTKAGADVVVAVSRTRSEDEAVADQVSELDRRSLVVVADVSDPADMNHIVTETISEFS